MDVPSATLLGEVQEGGGSATGEAATATQHPAAPVVLMKGLKESRFLFHSLNYAFLKDI